jgi:DNA-binding LacI/PurR family transcriptional regulator
VRESASDGLLIDYTHDVPPALEARLAKLKVPTVWLNTKREVDCVHIDDVAAGRAATQHLLDLGHRRIVYAGLDEDLYGHGNHYSDTDRQAGYEAAMVEAGLSPRVVRASVHEDHPGPERMRLVTPMLAADDRPTAVIAYGAHALMTWAYAAARQGLDVPRDLSLVTFGSTVTAFLGLETTTSLPPDRHIGRQGVAMLAERLKHPIHRPPARLQGELHVGQTTASPRGDASLTNLGNSAQSGSFGGNA